MWHMKHEMEQSNKAEELPGFRHCPEKCLAPATSNSFVLIRLPQALPPSATVPPSLMEQSNKVEELPSFRHRREKRPALTTGNSSALSHLSRAMPPFHPPPQNINSSDRILSAGMVVQICPKPAPILLICIRIFPTGTVASRTNSTHQLPHFATHHQGDRQETNQGIHHQPNRLVHFSTLQFLLLVRLLHSFTDTQFPICREFSVLTQQISVNYIQCHH